MKLSPLTIILIGVAILIMALSYGFFQHWMPNSTEAGYYNAYAEQLETEGNKLHELGEHHGRSLDTARARMAPERSPGGMRQDARNDR